MVEDDPQKRLVRSINRRTVVEILAVMVCNSSPFVQGHLPSELKASSKPYDVGYKCGFYGHLAGYHHIDIFAPHQKYFGFSWKFEGMEKYYVFTVLPLGLKSSGYVFTKVLLPFVAHWWRKSIKIVVYLDDGLGLADDTSELSRLGGDQYVDYYYSVDIFTVV
ncbi:Hypothetical predicted protein [Mytilus galloprovincialis]|uniref:Reverse transcriptase domain-containing protein n=1 Tax=Mytilus galloprovincialis TaxID=29158 RepID=A0A8B6GWM1_MYTGA|nr:Hypothetical predicted protein [Mytilus galloprovincialis]